MSLLLHPWPCTERRPGGGKGGGGSDPPRRHAATPPVSLRDGCKAVCRCACVLPRGATVEKEAPATGTRAVSLAGSPGRLVEKEIDRGRQRRRTPCLHLWMDSGPGETANEYGRNQIQIYGTAYIESASQARSALPPRPAPPCAYTHPPCPDIQWLAGWLAYRGEEPVV